MLTHQRSDSSDRIRKVQLNATAVVLRLVGKLLISFKVLRRRPWIWLKHVCVFRWILASWIRGQQTRTLLEVSVLHCMWPFFFGSQYSWPPKNCRCNFFSWNSLNSMFQFGLYHPHSFITTWIQDFEPLKTAVSQICANRAHLRLLLDEPELALEDCTKALEAHL